MLQDYTWDEIAGVFEKAHRRQPALAEYLEFAEKLVREEHASTVDRDIFRFDEAKLRERSTRGVPLLSREEFPLDLSSAQVLFHRLCEIAKGCRSEVREEALRIDAAVGEGEMDLQDLLRGAVAEEGYAFAIADQRSLDPELLQILAEASVRPSLQAAARAVAPWVETDRWMRTVCPVCGSEPKFAELRGQELAATRYLACGFCGFAWAIRRLCCPFCENKDHERLQTLIIENYLGCSLEVCDECHRYLKLVDSKEFIGQVPDVEVLVTPHLDVAAMDRGYH